MRLNNNSLLLLSVNNKNMKELLKSIASVKKEVGAISKDETNPFFKSKYFDINGLLKHVEPLLQENGLLLTQPIKDGSVGSIIYHTETGTALESWIALPQMSDPQKLGSAITYFRRYTLQSLLALQAEDDDGNKAARPQVKEKGWFNKGSDAWNKAVSNSVPIDTIKKYYKVSKEVELAYSEV